MSTSKGAAAVTEQSVDLTNCDREPIHILGTVQSHGMLLACTGRERKIVHVSANSAIILGEPPETIIGKTLDSMIGESAVAELMTSLEGASNSNRARVFRLKLANGMVCHAHIIHQAGTLIIELEPVGGGGDLPPPLELVSAMLSRMRQANSVSILCDVAAERMRALIQYDRIMIYKFLHDGSGRVVSEARRDSVVPFLDLHYPASDIPQQARALYLKSWIRLIADVGSEPVPIVPERDASGQPVDLSLTGLRSVSPIHIEYLQNMGVAASMSVSIIVGGKLWGLIACHHSSPKVVPADIRAAAELFGQVFSLQIEALEPSDRTDLVRVARSRIDQLLAQFPSDGELMENLTPRLSDLRALIPCDGIGLWIDGIWKAQGATPPVRDISALARMVEAAGGETTVFATHELSNRFPSASGYASDTSGMLTVPLSRTGRDYLMLFRREVVRTVKWGGDPNKPVTIGPNGDRLTPRKSFAAWEGDVRGQSLPWEQSDRLTAEALRISLLEVVLRLNEVAAREREKAAERQALLVAELNHRVKNVLALISALVKQGQSGNESITSFVKGLQGRVQALSFAHDQATQEHAGIIRQLFELETAPYVQASKNAIKLEGPAIALDAHAFSVLALVVHEMATNAAKYGALSVPKGGLTIQWSSDAAGDCVVDWRESGGPAVQAPSRTGFGTTLIDRQIPHELNGKSDVRYELTGVRARFVIPAKHIVSVAVEAAASSPARRRPLDSMSALAGLEILVVEDNWLIAVDIESMLQEAGAKSVDVVGTAAEALSQIEVKTFDVAVLDINLGNSTSTPVADELSKRGTPFVFASGYTITDMIPRRFQHIRIVGKPCAISDLTKAVLEAMGEAQGSS
jgi:light-regulated signal transduction histidine kinase (bacteriophytochrome)